jgi:hypothetical protein
VGILTLAEKSIVAYNSLALVFSVGSANVAQLVEQRIRNAWVAGSSPAVGSIEFAGQSLTRLAFLFLLTRIALPKKREYGADIISSASKYRQKVAKRRAFCSEKTAPVLYPLFLRGSAFGGLRFLLFLLLDFDTVGKNQNRHAWFSII